MTSIKSVRWLAFQGLGFRGNDESPSSRNRGNFIQLIKCVAGLNPDEVGDECFCILVDEAQDASNREQMAIILRFVNSHSSLIEHFFAIKRVSNTTSSNLKNEICDVLAQYELRVTLVVAAKEVHVIWNFFSHLDKIVNVITSSPERVTELQFFHGEEIHRILDTGERESRSGANQMILIDMYGATRKVLQYICDHCPNGRSQAEARGAYKKLEEFLQEVKSFCSKNNITIPDLEGLYNTGHSSDETIIEHYYHYDVFNEAIYFVMMELNTRFNDISVELLSLNAAFQDSFRLFDSRKICTLAEKFYPQDFLKQDIITLEFELPYYELDMKGESRFQVSTLSELCEQLIESRRSEIYIMMIRLIRLILTLHVFTASTERASSAIKHVKTTLNNKMEDDFLVDCMILFIVRELAEKIDLDSIIDEYYISNPRRERLK
ncbi:uncharacterized protein LOC111373745 [Olea europaea var. sylvestris]|uniref:uncharacterized protein LOC111373745 n=1 Tax=Olea europaea var. sylvestris TaxID=158386 RepID=UPI000C1D18CF|nr:uncharacterized protein LOC111373745 [Olea europaea var. sylvestris]